MVVRKRGGGGGGGGGGGAASTEKKCEALRATPSPLQALPPAHARAPVAVGGGGNAQKSGPGQRARKLDEATGEDGFKSAAQTAPSSSPLVPLARRRLAGL